MTKQVKEFLLDQATGEVNVEYDDDSTTKYNLSNAVTATQSAQGIVFEGGEIALGQFDGTLGVRKSYLGQVATRGLIPNNFSPTDKYVMSSMFAFARDNMASVQLVFPNWYVNGSPRIEQGTGADAQIRASIEYPVGTLTQVTFGGAAEGIIPDGQNLVSDPISVFIPMGAKFRIRSWWYSTAGILYNNRGFNGTGGDLWEHSPNALTDKTMSGTVSTASAGGYCPVAIVGQTTRPAILLLGDSRIVGSQDTVDLTADTGEFSRTIGRDFAYINAAVSGDTAAWFLASNSRRRALAGYCSHVMCDHGINDLTGSATLATMIAQTQSIAALFSPKSVTWATIAPNTTSTDSWATTGNQTVKSFEAIRTGFNDALRTGQVLGVSNYADVADATESARNSGVWKASYTADGLHEVLLGAQAIAASGVIQPWRFQL